MQEFYSEFFKNINMLKKLPKQNQEWNNCNEKCNRLRLQLLFYTVITIRITLNLKVTNYDYDYSK